MEYYNIAKERYARYGINTEKAIRAASDIPVSVHCWQGDDVVGFDGGGAASGGIQTTGNYPGRARNFEELTADLALAFSLMPGKKRLNLHASYAILNGEEVDRDAYRSEHFAPWVEFAREQGLVGIDFNPTLFSHAKVKDGLTLSSPDEDIRAFWVRHCKACLHIAGYLAAEMNSHCLVNIWIPDGFKDVPADRLAPRLRLKKSLDEILSEPFDREKVIVAVESKVFGIGVMSSIRTTPQKTASAACWTTGTIIPRNTSATRSRRFSRSMTKWRSTSPAECAGTATMSSSSTTRSAR